MKIVILGAGQVGGSLAGTLSIEANDITLVDINQERLADLEDRFDIRTVQGSASHPGVLVKAGLEDADMLIAVTSSDEINMLACHFADTLFHTPTKIGRVRHHDYLSHNRQGLVGQSIDIDVLIHPERLITEQIARLLANQGASQITSFADDKVQLISATIPAGNAMIGQIPSYIHTLVPEIEAFVIAVYREGYPLLPIETAVIKGGDELSVVVAAKDARRVLGQLGRVGHPYKKVMIAGGGNIGFLLAQSAQRQYQIKVIERNRDRCQWLAENLENSIVICGSASDNELLIEERIDEIDFFCALTDNDETNILSSMLARRMGARTIVTLINNPAYVELIQGDVIDIAVSPQHTTVGSILSHIRRGDVVIAHPLRQGAAEAIEAIAHGDRRSSKVVGRAIDDIRLPAGGTIGAIVREGNVMMARGDLIIEDNDHVIILLTDRGRVKDIERLFQVGLSFF